MDFGLGQRQRDIADRVDQVCRTHCSAAEESPRDASSEFPDELYRALGSAGGTRELQRNVIAREPGLR